MVIFAQNFSKIGLKRYYFLQLSKRQKMAKRQNHFISGKQFHKMPNGNPDIDISKKTMKAKQMFKSACTIQKQSKRFNDQVPNMTCL